MKSKDSALTRVNYHYDYYYIDVLTVYVIIIKRSQN